MINKCSLAWMTVALLLVGCFGSDHRSTNSGAERSRVDPQKGSTMQLTSTAFDNGATIPSKYTGVGQDVSPPLAWLDVPEGTQSFALVCDDPDAPSRSNPRPEGPWVHWVIYNIPANVAQLPEALPRQAELTEPASTRQGRNDFGRDNVGYRGPMPPQGSGAHRYFFRIYALDRPLDVVPEQASKQSLLATIKDHILAEGQLMGTFERK